MTSRYASDDHSDNGDGICVNCQLSRALNEWRDAGGSVESVIEAVRAVVDNIVYAALDEIFEEAEPERPVTLDG